MYEELLTRDEGVRATKHERIFTTQVKQVDRNVLAERLEILHDHLGDNLLVVRTQLKRLVAEYNQWTGGEKQDVVGSHGS